MSDAALYDHTKSALSAISTSLQSALRQDLDTLRAAVEERVKAIEATIGQPDLLFDRVVQDICEVAAADAEQAAMHARLHAEQAAQRDLDAARAQAQEEIAALRAELDAARATLETQMAERQAERAEATTALANAQQEIAASRRAWDEQAVSLDEAVRRVRALEEDYAQWTLAQQVVEANLEQERQRRKTIAIQLETAHEELRLAKAEAKSCRLEAQQLADRVQRLKDAQMPSDPTVHMQEGARPGNGDAVLDRVRIDLKALGNAETAAEMLTILLESLSQRFLTVALFAVGPDGFKLWGSRTADSRTDVVVPAGPLAAESPLVRAFRERTLIMDDAASGGGALAPSERQVGQVAALPILLNDRVIAVAYVENPHDRLECDVTLFTQMAEILIDRVNERLRQAKSVTAGPLSDRALTVERTNAGPTVTETPHYVLARQARRVPIQEGVKVLIDGVASVLVDLSTLGAQIVSPNAMRPNRPVRIVLPRQEGALSCRGRIVWARVERAQEDESVLYRAGVEFTEANASAVQAFVTQHGMPYLPAEPTMKS